jgi:hypothetical protein
LFVQRYHARGMKGRLEEQHGYGYGYWMILGRLTHIYELYKNVETHV